jgi:hypothetical protein
MQSGRPSSILLLKGKLSTVYLLVLTSLEQLVLTVQTLITFVQNKFP